MPGLVSGFTLIELLVVSAIIIIITGVIFSGQVNFSNTVVLTSTAYDVALSIRDAETYGLGTRAQGGTANAGYGLDFKSATPTSYLLFADSYPPPGGPGACHTAPVINGAQQLNAPNAYPGNCYYDANDAVVSKYQLGNGVAVSHFCASLDNGNTWSCSTGGGGGSLPQLDIIFSRPNAAAYISANGVSATNACITLAATQGQRFITVSTSGEINATAASCP